MNNEINDITFQATNKYKDVNIKLNNELKKFLNEYDNHIKEISRLKSNLLNILTETKNFQKINNASITDNFDINNLNIEDKSVNELINLLMDDNHYGLARLTEEEYFKNNFFIQVIKNMELKTNENYVLNFLYSNLYEKLSNEEITKIFNEIKVNETNNNESF